MIADRNKTELTRALTAAVVRYLDERGFKPVETEVHVCDGWIADIAGVISPTQTELQELKLIPRAPSWRSGGRDKWNEQAKAAQILMTCLVEVKTSMSDFRNDRKWTWLEKQFPVNLPYIAIPSTLPLERSQYPLSWGVLEYNEKNDTVRIVQIPEVWRMTVEQQLSVILEIAIRRDHHTRHARIRELRKEQVVRHNADVSRKRVAECMRAMMAIVSGASMGGKALHESLEAALEYHGIKHLAEYDMIDLQKLWRLNVKEEVSRVTSLVLDKQRRGDNGVIQNLRCLCDSVAPNVSVPVLAFIQAARAFHGHHTVSQIVLKALWIIAGKVNDEMAPLTGDRPIFYIIAQSKVAHGPTPAGNQYRRIWGESAKRGREICAEASQ